MPLLNRQLSGVPMLVALLESGEEMLSYFEFDVPHLERLINGRIGEERVVAHEDIEMLAIGIINPDYLATRIAEKLATNVEPSIAFDALRHYLFRKYQVRAYLGNSTGGDNAVGSGEADNSIVAKAVSLSSG
jgi:hypothetical protein